MLIHCNVIHSFDVHIFHKQLPILLYIGNVLIQKEKKGFHSVERDTDP